MTSPWQDAIARARAHSPFLSVGLDRLPELAKLLEGGEGEAALGLARSAGVGIDDVGVAMRREKLAFAVALAIGDLAGEFALAKVVGELSDLADRTLDRAIEAAIRQRVPDVESQGFTALALGKHGAGELNYSSDIDPILLFDPTTLPRRERDDPGEAAQRVARRVSELMGALTAEGYVFRIDLRLRPASEVSPLAISFDAALSHYESSALAWERAAFIRARAAAGDIEKGEEFLAQIRPFIWRRSLDFGAIEEIRRLTKRIRSNHDGPSRPGPGFNIKQGRGGIREVEFFAQTHQLIHGGRYPALRLRGTRETLDALAAQGIIAGDDAKVLGESYDRLRAIEHRLQMVDDRQTHSLPQSAEALENVARLDGHADGAELVAELEEITAKVAARYDSLIDEPDNNADPIPASGGSALEARLAELGFGDAGRLAKRIEGWSDGRTRALRTPAARAAFENVAPALFEALAAAPEPEQALLRWESLLVSLPSAINLFRLLEARPGLLEQLVEVLFLAPPLADELTRRPELLDALIDKSVLNLPGSVEALVGRMSRSEEGDNYEDRLDRIRRVVGEVRFALGVQLISGAQDPLDIAAALSRTAEAALQVAGDAAVEEFARQHGTIPGEELLVLGLGRLGGGVLTHASDLDLVYLFNGAFERESDGRRPLSATHYFNRLAQRLTAALSVPTAAGALYEVDTRLRPQGNQGPLVVTLESFERYQREDAWTWEHMALCRARPLYGSKESRKALQAIIRSILDQQRDPAKLKQDALKMRSDMAAHKEPSGPLDCKLLRGGLVDLEFITHFLQLRERTGFSPNLREALAMLIDAGHLPAEIGDAHDNLSRLLIAERLLAADGAMPGNAASAVLARACKCGTGPADILRQLSEARQVVATCWTETFGENLEVEAL